MFWDAVLLSSVREQPMDVLFEPPIAHRGETELELDHREVMLDLGAHTGLGFILGPLDFIDSALVTGAPVGEVLGLRCLGADQFTLALVGAIAPHPRLGSM